MEIQLMKNHRNVFSIALTLTILLVVAGSGVVLGQGGTGREPAPPPKKPSPTRKPLPRATVPQIEMVLIPAGTFMMGSPPGEVGRSNDEGPQHRVSVQSFYMGKYEVTQAQYRAVMGTNPSNFKGDNLPV